MFRKLIITGIAAFTLTGGAGAALAHGSGGNPGPNGHNTFGLCTAWGHIPTQAQSAPPFTALQAAASAANESVAQYCAANGQQPGRSGH